MEESFVLNSVSDVQGQLEHLVVLKLRTLVKIHRVWFCSSVQVMASTLQSNSEGVLLGLLNQVLH